MPGALDQRGLEVSRIVVTSGAPYIDIDAYAGSIAYAELLRRQGKDAIAVSTSIINESVTSQLRQLSVGIEHIYNPLPNDRYVLIDVSDPEHFDTFVDHSKIVGIVDHHTGWEKLWHSLGDQANIEFIGAACTQVYETWQKGGILDKMPPDIAKLLCAGVLDNTLNFGAKITTNRDRKAFEQLAQIANISDDWVEQYFKDCDGQIMKDLKTAILNDVKQPVFNLQNEPVGFGQLLFWDAAQALETERKAIEAAMSSVQPVWFMNNISLKDKKSIFVTSDPKIEVWLSELLGIEFRNGQAIADRLWLRKEVMKAAQEVA